MYMYMYMYRYMYACMDDVVVNSTVFACRTAGAVFSVIQLTTAVFHLVHEFVFGILHALVAVKSGFE